MDMLLNGSLARLEYVSGMFWTCLGNVSEMFRTCFGDVLDKFRICFGQFLGISFGQKLGHIPDIFCHSVA